MADEQALDQALTDLNGAVDQIIAKLNEAGVDLTDEIATVQDITKRISDAIAAPPPEPTPEPGPEGTTEPT